MKYTHRYLVPLILVILFAAPGLAAYYFYHHPEWLGGAKINRGQLLTPPFLLKSSQSESEKWQLVLWSPLSCERDCKIQLDKLARIRLTLGRRLYDVEVKLLLGHEAARLSDDTVAALNDQAIVLSRLNRDTRQFVPQLPSQPKLYIANPTGYMILAYPANAQPDDIHHDLKRLLNIKE